MISGAPNGSVPLNICSYIIYNLQLVSKKNEQINSIFVNFLTIYEKCFDAYLLMYVELFICRAIYIEYFQTNMYMLIQIY